MVKVKVCGITNLNDALKAVEFGADALGFNFYPPSPRCIAPEQARSILKNLPPQVCSVALFVNEPREKVKEVINYGRLPDGRQAFSGLQFHGDEDQEYCRGWESLLGMERFPADFYLLDSWAPGYGGSGSPFPWSWLEGIAPEKLILAGGLDAQNIAEAVRRVRPFGVDVCTGVEARPGIKDHEKVKEFIIAAKSSA
jgi:phosphoribosylanthranilate isomerase